MRRMTRPSAAAMYLALRPSVLAQGALMAAASLLPVLNLFVPVLGTAAMVHVLHGCGRFAPGGPHGVATPGRV
jgi:CysZ protein